MLHYVLKLSTWPQHNRACFMVTCLTDTDDKVSTFLYSRVSHVSHACAAILVEREAEHAVCAVCSVG